MPKTWNMGLKYGIEQNSDIYGSCTSVGLATVSRPRDRLPAFFLTLSMKEGRVASLLC